MSQLSFLSIGLGKKRLRCERFLDEMSSVMPWDCLCTLIRPHYATGKGGRPPIPLEQMLKIHCLQQWYGLSDPAMEEAIYDRNSFQKFLKIDLLSDQVPDETTILNFRHLLEEHDLARKIFDEINAYLMHKGLLLKEGTIVDATLIDAPSSTKNTDKKRDPEMSSTKKGNQWYFGMKAHIGTQLRGKPLIHSVETGTAKEHDKKKKDDLMHGNERAEFGDKGYADDKDKRKARGKGVFYGVLDKAKRGKKLSSKQKRRNKKLSSVRAKVEHPFQILKCQWGYSKVRYRGLKKNDGQIVMLCALANIFMVRRSLLPTP
ncbi:MAG: IS5 family transposase [bacterium]|nr:IS5 family transposase [bacterium]